MEEVENHCEKPFSWPGYPTDSREFEALMQAIDQSLQEEGVPVSHRPLAIAPKFGQAFGWQGSVFPPRSHAELPGYSGDVLMAKAHAWYEKIYRDILKAETCHGYVPVKLGNAIWRMVIRVGFGQGMVTVNRDLRNASNGPFINVLSEIEGLSQEFVNRLTDEALDEVVQFYLLARKSLQWRDELPPLDLFEMARADYAQCTEDVLSRRYGQARWGAQQAVEKTLKGFLLTANAPFPTGGPKGHDLKHLASLLKEKMGVSLSNELLDLAACSAKVRYGEEPSDETQALSANHAVLGILEQLRNNSGVLNLLAGEHRP